MDDTNLTRLRLLESELVHLQRAATQLSVRIFEIHETVVEMLNHELASPLTR